MIAIEYNNATVALARKEDVIECFDASMADTLRHQGYIHLGYGATSRPATDTEQARYSSWLLTGRAS
jgi:hypothetical protein